MKRIIVKFIQIGLLTIWCLIISCATSSKHQKISVAYEETNLVFVDPSLLIFVLTPNFTYESVYTEKEIDFNQKEIILEKNLEIRTLKALESMGFNCKNESQIINNSASYEKEYSEILNNSNLIFRAYIEEEFKKTIENFGIKSGIPAIMIINCEAKVGTGGSYNSYSGAITSKNDRTVIKALLIKTSDCSKLWSNSVQLRELPEIGDSDYEKAINSIFTNLKAKGE